MPIIRRNKRRGLIEYLIQGVFLILPFSLFLNTLLFGNIRIMGIGFTNFFIDIVIFLAFIDSFLRPKRYKTRNSIYFFLIVFAVLHLIKFLASEYALTNFSSWFLNNQYYYFLPLIVLMLSNKKVDHDIVANNIIYGSWIICPLSIFMFLSSQYFGMVSAQNMLVYDIVGTPFARMFSVFGSPNVAGTYFCLVILICYFKFGFRHFWVKVLLALNLLCLILTFSKGSMIALVFVMLYQYLFVASMKNANKYVKILILSIAFFGGISFVSSRGFYFWQVNEIVQNVRLIKWAEGIKAISDNWLLGSEFTQHIYSSNTWESTLSDNSFLLSMGFFGIPFVLLTVSFLGIKIGKMNKEKRKKIIPGIVVIVSLCIVYDFIQMFPTNYIAIFFIMYLYERNGLSETQIRTKKKL